MGATWVGCVFQLFSSRTSRALRGNKCMGRTYFSASTSFTILFTLSYSEVARCVALFFAQPMAAN